MFNDFLTMLIGNLEALGIITTEVTIHTNL